MVVFYKESPTGWQNLNRLITNEENKCVKFDGTIFRSLSQEEENTIYLFHNFNEFEAVQGLFWTEVHDWNIYEEKICSTIGDDTEIGLALYEVDGENQNLQEYFVDLSKRKGCRLHLFYMGDWKTESDSYRSLLRTILNVDQYASVCFWNRNGMDDLPEEYEGLICDDFRDAMKKAAALPRQQEDGELYLYNHARREYEPIELRDYENAHFQYEMSKIDEFVMPGGGKKTCKMLRELRQKYAKKYNAHWREDPCGYKGFCKGTCPVCDENAERLWMKTQEKEDDFKGASQARACIRGIERLRIDTDGKGIRTLVAMDKCMLQCRYCINEEYINKLPLSETVTTSFLQNKIKKDAVYFEMTGGGVTFGGGEPLLYADFIREFHEKYPEWNLAVQTSLNVESRSVEQLISAVGTWYIDIKDMNPEIYERYTGCANDMVLRNLRYLQKHVSPGRIVVRVPHIPGFNNEEDVAKSIQQLKEMGIENMDEFKYIIPQQR